jgi:hypothetical protein
MSLILGASRALDPSKPQAVLCGYRTAFNAVQAHGQWNAPSAHIKLDGDEVPVQTFLASDSIVGDAGSDVNLTPHCTSSRKLHLRTWSASRLALSLAHWIRCSLAVSATMDCFEHRQSKNTGRAMGLCIV